MFVRVLEKTVRRRGLLERGDRVLVAVSGGPDSVALLRGLIELRSRYDLSLTVGHFNHGLRGAASDAEERFVAELALKAGLELRTGRMPTASVRPRGRSLEDWCREHRYAFLDATAREIQAGKIALGHHRRDQAETVLMNLLRGSGIEGLKGILPIRDGRYIRPLLDTDPAEIRAFLESRSLSFRNDASNRDIRHLRNRIRHDLLPRLETVYNPAIVHGISRMAEIAGLENDFMESVLPEAYASAGGREGQGGVRFDIPAFLTLHEAIQNRLILLVVRRLIGAPSGLTHAHIQLVRNLLGRSGYAEVHLAGGITATRSYDHLSFQQTADVSSPASRSQHRPSRLRRKGTDAEAGFQFDVPIPGVLSLAPGCRLRFEVAGVTRPVPTGREIACLDYERIRFPLVCR
ncbi:MAG TPA: tRNA lysidine(34) synthetase TilS, partial [Syntrophus sp. (in: bacteria)]|nr:tRNA lysidine(34) synthetase TilS [Syntrophus sp. (in: bacteria)]